MKRRQVQAGRAALYCSAECRPSFRTNRIRRGGGAIPGALQPVLQRFAEAQARWAQAILHDGRSAAALAARDQLKAAYEDVTREDLAHG